MVRDEKIRKRSAFLILMKKHTLNYSVFGFTDVAEFLEEGRVRNALLVGGCEWEGEEG